MRFSYYKMINDMLGTLKDALDYMKASGDRTMFEVCVRSLQTIINALESNPSDIKEPSIIENINALLKNFVSENMDIEAASALAEKLCADCRKGIDYRIKVLFVAELGGKWDSMASVYDECMKRDDIDVDVVLEPVFREVKLSDGTIRHEEIYNDWLTPMGIKNIPYKKYDMKKVQPDITFFSQPYEGCTDKMFWPENMSKYTRVVYLPYYSALTLNSNYPAFEPFFRLPTEKYSWRIACQSVQMKKYYELYASRKGENVIPCGIPKWDHPFKFNKETVKCPDEWKEKLSGRKVFLWNTHFRFLSNEKVPFSTEKEIINIFLNDPDNIALIWRPHPMTETVIKTYNPELYPMYEQLLDIIGRSSNMIIDRSPGYSSAFVCSDALITAFSSITDQYTLMNKPFTIYENISETDALIKHYSPDKLFDFHDYYISERPEDVKRFIYELINGNDPSESGRKAALSGFYKNADGSIGKRLTEILIEDFLEEQGMFEKKLDTERVDTALIIGSSEDSRSCTEHLRKNGVEYCFCSDILSVLFDVSDEKVFSVSELRPDSFEYVIVTSKDMEKMICDILYSHYDIPKEKIIPFHSFKKLSYDGMLCDKVMSMSDNNDFDGIILGSTRAAAAVWHEKLDGDWCDLSVPYQDIYYMKKTLEYCAKNYPEKIGKIKYAVIDLNDYYYFNYDVSVTPKISDYIMYGGYSLESHHFNRNKYFEGVTFKNAIGAFNKERYTGVNKTALKTWQKLFAGISGSDAPHHERSVSVITDEQVQKYDYTPEYVSSISEKTVKDNMNELCDIIDILRKINPDIRIFTVLIPRFFAIELNQLPLTANHVEYFNDIVDKLKDSYGFTHVDLKDISDISEKRFLYMDGDRVNRLGAELITQKLNKIIFEK